MSRARQYAQDAAHAFERAPMEVALALFACITLSWSIEIGGFAFPRWLELAVPVALAFLVAWGATLLHALGRITPLQRAAITLVGGLLACAYAGWVINFEHEAEVWRAFVLVAGMVAAVAAVPAAFTRNADPNLAFRRINGRILLRAIGVLLYASALFAGLALALGAVDKLFELHLHGEIYAHVFGWLMVGLVPWVLVGGLPDYVAPLQKQSEVARVVYRLALYLIPPLLALYVAILYAYAIRIGITHEVPKNLVSPMVVAAGILAAAAIVLCDPRVDEPSALRYLRWAPAVFLPLGVLGIWAITPRISQYGWTIFRLLRVELLVVLVLLAAAGAFMVWRRRPFPLWEVAVTFAITAAVAVIGPWSTLAISKRDQQRRLTGAFDRAGVNLGVPPSPIDTARRVIPGPTYDQINNTAMYLRREYGDAAFRQVLPAHARTDLALADLPGYYHLRRSEPRPGPAGSFARLGGGTIVEADSSTTARRITYNQGAPRNEPEAPLVTADQSSLRIALGTDILTVSVSDVLAAMHPPGDSRGVQLASNAAVPVRDISGKRRGTLVLLEVSTSGDTTLTRIAHLDALLLLKNEPAAKK